MSSSSPLGVSASLLRSFDLALNGGRNIPAYVMYVQVNVETVLVVTYSACSC